MPDFHQIWSWVPEKRDLFLEWLENEPNIPDVSNIADDGRFRVHNGRISGNEFILTSDGKKKVNQRRSEVYTRHFNVKQVNPLPEGLEED